MSSDVGVLIVDDSSIVRRVLSRELDRQRGIKVLGTALDPFIARDKILALKPDVITLDIEMPRMDGLTFLRKIMKYHPVPTIIVSSLTKKGCQTAIACLESGAVDVVSKPGESYSVGDLAAELGDLIRGAARIKLPKRAPGPKPAATGQSVLIPNGDALIETTHKVIAIGTSTGGTEALRKILSRLPRQMPGIVMVQHMPEDFTTSFAQRLNELSQIDVREAVDGDAVIPGRALLAPGNRHMRLARDGARYVVRISDGPRVCRHRPSVEVLFDTTAHYAGANAMGAILTGMGHDGADGLLAMRKAGALTLAQDEASCVVFGMPREAIDRGGAQIVSPLDQVHEYLLAFASGTLKAKAA